MNLFADMLAVAFSSAPFPEKVLRAIGIGMVPTIFPGLMIFYIFWTQTKKDENRWKSMWPTAWVVLGFWFLLGFTLPWICAD